MFMMLSKAANVLKNVLIAAYTIAVVICFVFSLYCLMVVI